MFEQTFKNIKFSYKGLNQSGVYAMETKTIFTEKVREYDLTILSKNVFRLNTKIEHSLLGLILSSEFSLENNN